MGISRTYLTIITLFLLAIALNVGLWSSVRDVQVKWINVPPTPSLSGALWSALGDPQLAYRGYGIMIQNMGDTGGKVVNLRSYDYGLLGAWFRLQHKLDPNSGFSPFLAGYFFGAVRDNEKLTHIIDYLELAAGDGEGQKWRYLGQAAFIARFRMQDTELALELANKLSAFENPKMAQWARQMPIFILTAQGEKEAAYTMMVNLLKTSAGSLHPNEVNATLDYLCTRILEGQEVLNEPLCRDYH